MRDAKCATPRISTKTGGPTVARRHPLYPHSGFQARLGNCRHRNAKFSVTLGFRAGAAHKLSRLARHGRTRSDGEGPAFLPTEPAAAPARRARWTRINGRNRSPGVLWPRTSSESPDVPSRGLSCSSYTKSRTSVKAAAWTSISVKRPRNHGAVDSISSYFSSLLTSRCVRNPRTEIVPPSTTEMAPMTRTSY